MSEFHVGFSNLFRGQSLAIVGNSAISADRNQKVARDLEKLTGLYDLHTICTSYAIPSSTVQSYVGLPYLIHCFEQFFVCSDLRVCRSTHQDMTRRDGDRLDWTKSVDRRASACKQTHAS